jgi:hypothetical protein
MRNKWLMNFVIIKGNIRMYLLQLNDFRYYDQRTRFSQNDLFRTFYQKKWKYILLQHVLGYVEEEIHAEKKINPCELIGQW